MARGRRFGPAIKMFYTEVHPGGRGDEEATRRRSAGLGAVDEGHRVAYEMLTMLLVGLFGGGGPRARHWWSLVWGLPQRRGAIDGGGGDEANRLVFLGCKDLSCFACHR